MSFSVYTSCALNYLPKARALAESLARHVPGTRLTLCLCDEVPEWLDLAEEPFDRVWLPRDLGFTRQWIFEHTTMELCTAVKGAALMRLQNEDDAQLHAYLDPDVYLFHALDPVLEMMEGASIGLVPHILAPESTDAGIEATEMSVTSHGIYNLGHLFVRPDETGRAFARWWAERLEKYCFDDRQRGLFTDQRWVDLVPAIFEGVRILRDPGLDVASWNIAQRAVRQAQPGDDQSFRIGERPLISYHFSGTGPSGTHRKVRERFDPCNPATAEIERVYEAVLTRHAQEDLATLTPAFELFDNGIPVPAIARRLYRDHADLQRAFPDPYADTASPMSYLEWLRSNRPALFDRVTLAPDRWEAAYLDLFDEDYYLWRYPSVAHQIAEGRFPSALDHYERLGSALLMDPNEFFVSSFYLNRVLQVGSDVPPVSAGRREGTLLWHYVSAGLALGADPIEFFDSTWYLRNNPDLETALRTRQISSPLGHYLRYGSAEGRDPSSQFSGNSYLARSPEARALVDKGEARGAFGAFLHLDGVCGRLAALPVR